MRNKKGRMMFLIALAASAWLGAMHLPTLHAVAQSRATESINRPVISEDTSPLEPIAPVSKDGHRGLGVLRRPPGAGPFPALVWIHGGLATRPQASLREYMLSPNPSRFLAAGYVVAVITYRSRDEDPQSSVSREDSLGAVDHVRRLPYVDPQSVVVFGCSGGGDLALEIATATDVAAIAAEEPASMLFTGVFNRELPKKGARYTPEDGGGSADPRAYTAKYQQFTRDKIARIRCPILIVQGDPEFRLNRFNAAVLIPELQQASKSVEVRTYPGEPHCFAFYGSGPRTPRPAAALKAFHDVDAFFRGHLNTKPKAIDPKLVQQESLEPM
jgi:dipeptidyl aminopeptidase/acylaminoacyl peptidase